MNTQQPGQIVLMGSGETSPNMQRVYRWLFQQIPPPVRVAILETPAGFEVNSHHVAAQIGAYLEHHLQNFAPQVTIVPARKRGTAFSPDDPKLIEPLYEANVILMGPGSPSYAVRQLQESVTWHTLRALHRQGTALMFASAGALALSVQTLPVYEIYKVGEDVHVKDGLDFFADFGMQVSFVPHWNNAEGGVDLDTSRCFIGMERFNQWRNLTPSDNIIVGLDEHSGIIMDCEKGVCDVHGVSSVSVLKSDTSEMYASGSSFSLMELGNCAPPNPIEKGIRSEVWEMITSAQSAETDEPSEEVLALLEQRQQARANKDFAESDRLRDQISSLGWTVQDSKAGQTLVKK